MAQLIREGSLASTSIEVAFRRVRRHWFLPDAALDEVYRDLAVVTHRDTSGVPISSSSQPTIMARMLRQLDVQPGHQVLEALLNGAQAARLEDLTIVGIPRGKEITGSSTLTTLTRPNITFAVSHPGRPSGTAFKP